MKLTPEQRAGHVEFITTNCSCWSGKNDKKVLNAFDDDKLIEIREHVEEEVENKIIANAAREGFSVAGVEFVFNAEGRAIARKGAKEVDVTENGDGCEEMMAGKGKKKGKKAPSVPAMNGDDEDDDEDDDTPAANGKGLTKQQIGTAVSNYLKSLTPEQHLAMLPADMQTAVRNGIKADKRERTQLIGLLVANVSDADEKKKHTARYAKMDTDDLREEVKLRGLSRNDRGAGGDRNNPNDLDAYFGGSGGSDRRRPTVNAEDVLPLPGDPGYLVNAEADEDE